MRNGWRRQKIFSKITAANSPTPRKKGGKALQNKPPTFSANADISIAHHLPVAPTGPVRENSSLTYLIQLGNHYLCDAGAHHLDINRQQVTLSLWTLCWLGILIVKLTDF